MSIVVCKRVGSMAAVAALLYLSVLWVSSIAPTPVLADPGMLFVTPAGGGTACTQAAPCSLATALAQAVDGDSIYLGQGTYTGSGAGAVITLSNSVNLYGGWDGTVATPPRRDWQAYPTTLDGQEARGVLRIGVSGRPVVEGLIITRGRSVSGGGIDVRSGAPLMWNVITANQSITAPRPVGGHRGRRVHADTTSVPAGGGEGVLAPHPLPLLLN